MLIFLSLLLAFLCLGSPLMYVGFRLIKDCQKVRTRTLVLDHSRNVTYLMA